MAPGAEDHAYLELTDWIDTAPQPGYERTGSIPEHDGSPTHRRHFSSFQSHRPKRYSVQLDSDEGSTPLINNHSTSTAGVGRSLTISAPQAVDTAYRGYDGRRSSELGRSKTLLQRLGSLRPAHFGASLNPRRDRYFALDKPESSRDNAESYNVDISSLEGSGGYFRYHNAGISEDEAEPSKALGSGVVVGREIQAGTIDESNSSNDINLTLDPAADRVARSATIRKYGQKLAQDTNMIVSVKDVSKEPTVDITSLGALGRPSSTISGSPKLSSTATDLADLSYFYPADPEQPNWKPLSMRPFYIIMLVVLSLVLAGVQEYLCQKSQSMEREGGGLVAYHSLDDIPTGLFFCWKYLPTIAMVSYGVLWQVTDYDVQRLEPYYQLSRPTGNIASKSLSLDYVTLWAYFVPFKAIKNRHWVVLTSSIATILATTAAPSLQNPSIMSIENPKCRGHLTDCGNDRYFLRIHPVWSRLVTGCLGVVAVISILLLFQLRRKSGLLSDPRGVAGIASMATKSHILTDFHGMDENLHDEIHEKLGHRRYILYKSTIWQGEYIKQNTHSNKETENHKPQNPHPIMLRTASLLAFITFMTICLPFIPAISYTGLTSITHSLPWLPILVAALIKQLWATLEFAIKMMEPFHSLSLGNARPESTLTLDYQGVPYGLLPVKALYNKHYIVSIIGFCSILGDILTVTCSSLSLRTETEHSFYTSSILSVIILFLLILATILVVFKRRKPFMPRQPSTIASVLAFVHQSRMLDDFIGTERYSHSQMENMLISKGKRYGLGWFRGRDNRPHCAIDQEPMLSRYVHGVSYIRAQAPWEENVGY